MLIISVEIIKTIDQRDMWKKKEKLQRQKRKRWERSYSERWELKDLVVRLNILQLISKACLILQSN